jgi:hypothetical protein
MYEIIFFCNSYHLIGACHYKESLYISFGDFNDNEINALLHQESLPSKINE